MLGEYALKAHMPYRRSRRPPRLRRQGARRAVCRVFADSVFAVFTDPAWRGARGRLPVAAELQLDARDAVAGGP